MSLRPFVESVKPTLCIARFSTIHSLRDSPSDIDDPANGLEQIGEKERYHVDVNMGLYWPFFVSCRLTLSYASSVSRRVALKVWKTYEHAKEKYENSYQR